MHQDLNTERDGRSGVVLPAGRGDERGRRGLRLLRGDGLRGSLASRPGAEDAAAARLAVRRLLRPVRPGDPDDPGPAHPARRARGRLIACAPWPTPWSRSRPWPTPLISPRSRSTSAVMAPRPTAPAPSLDDHLPAVGLGKPINRTLWTLIWGVAALIFQAMGITYLFGGADLHAPVRPRRHRLVSRARPRSSSGPRSASWP